MADFVEFLYASPLGDTPLVNIKADGSALATTAAALGKPSLTSSSRGSPGPGTRLPAGSPTSRPTATLWPPLLAAPGTPSLTSSGLPVDVLVLVLNSDFETVFNASQHFLKMLSNVRRAQR